MSEHQATTTDYAVAARELMVQQEVNQKVAVVCVALADEYLLKLELLEAELEGKTTALKTNLESAEQRKRSAPSPLFCAKVGLPFLFRVVHGANPRRDRLSVPNPTPKSMDGSPWLMYFPTALVGRR